MADHPNWLDAPDWKWAQDTLPIACADVVPVQVDADGHLQKIGLIYRDTPHQGKRWCVVGGRMWRNESLVESASRQLHETLGATIRFFIPPDRQPDYVAQYFSLNRPDCLHDPRQHAITLVLAVPITGQITPGGEAHLFQWFDPDALPTEDKFGFGQLTVVSACLAKWPRKQSR